MNAAIATTSNREQKKTISDNDQNFIQIILLGQMKTAETDEKKARAASKNVGYSVHFDMHQAFG